MPQVDMQLAYTEDELQVAYELCDDMFAQEFADFMQKLGAIPLDEV